MVLIVAPSGPPSQTVRRRPAMTNRWSGPPTVPTPAGGLDPEDARMIGVCGAPASRPRRPRAARRLAAVVGVAGPMLAAAACGGGAGGARR